MKKKSIVIIITIMIIFNINIITNAEENNTTTNENIIKSQSDSLNIGSFLDETKSYSTEILDGLDMSNILSDAISGNIDNSSIGKKVLEKLFKELLEAIASIGSIIIIVMIHSVLKNITDGLENNSVSQITYYVTYILIVTVIMKNFADIINLMKTSIENLVGFVNCLFPILITLLATSGGIKSATILQPIILFIITLVSNAITKIIIPFSLISVALAIVSNISDKVQISKLSKFINSTTIWVLGIILTVIVTVASLESSLSSGVDSVTVKTAKAAVSGCIPVVGKILRRCSRNCNGVHKHFKKCSRNSWNNCCYRNMRNSYNKITYINDSILFRSCNM